MIYLSRSRKINLKKGVTVAFTNESTKVAKHTRLKHPQLLFISHARLKIIRKSSLILSADLVDNINFLQRFPEKVYGSNCLSYAVLKTRSLLKAAII